MIETIVWIMGEDDPESLWGEIPDIDQVTALDKADGEEANNAYFLTIKVSFLVGLCNSVLAGSLSKKS